MVSHYIIQFSVLERQTMVKVKKYECFRDVGWRGKQTEKKYVWGSKATQASSYHDMIKKINDQIAFLDPKKVKTKQETAQAMSSGW